jgi:hypothetical protein
MKDNTTQKAYKEARKKVKAIRGFYFNLLVYIAAHLVFIYFNLIYNLQFNWFWYSILLWGIGMAVYGMIVFDSMPFMKRNWEEQKLRELIGNKEEKKGNDAEGQLNEQILYNRAKKKIHALRNFYRHLTAYIVVIILLLVLLWVGFQKKQDLFIYIAYGAAFGWSIGLLIHIFKVFGVSFLIGKNWEELKLIELIQEENKK